MSNSKADEGASLSVNSDEGASLSVNSDEDGDQVKDCQAGRRKQSVKMAHAAKTESSLTPAQFNASHLQTRSQTRSTNKPAQASANSKQSSDLESALLFVTKSWQGAPLPDESAGWYEFYLPPLEFSEFRQRLKSDRLLDYFENALYWDYSPGRGSLVLRLMATALHEILQEELSDHIKDTLKHRVSLVSPDFASKIKSYGSTRLRLGFINGETSSKCPDLQFRFDGGIKPPFVAEIGYSQRKKSLRQLAHDYCIGMIKTVLTIDVDYNPPAAAETKCEAVYCLYRNPDRVNNNTPFRNTDGSTAPGALQLELADFIPDQVLQDVTEEIRDNIGNCHIEITHDLLCKWLERAEMAELRENQAKDNNTGQPSEEPRFPNWSDPSDDNDDTGEEETSQERETRAAKKRKDPGDRLYCPPSSIKAAATRSAASADNRRYPQHKQAKRG
jgi:hypothetical protein